VRKQEERSRVDKAHPVALLTAYGKKRNKSYGLAKNVREFLKSLGKLIYTLRRNKMSQENNGGS